MERSLSLTNTRALKLKQYCLRFPDKEDDIQNAVTTLLMDNGLLGMDTSIIRTPP